MKTTLHIITLAAAVTSCAFFPTTTRTVAVGTTIKNDDVLECAVEAAREANFPPMTKMDKADGIVEFGGFEGPELGLSAQVWVRPDGQAEIVVKRGSVYIPLGVDKQAELFQAKLEQRLHSLATESAK